MATTTTLRNRVQRSRILQQQLSLSLSLSTILKPWPRGDEPRTKLQNRVFYTVLHCIYSAVSSRHTRWTVVVVRSIFRITQTFISMYTVTLRNSPISFPLPPSIYTRLEIFFFFDFILVYNEINQKSVHTFHFGIFLVYN